MVKMENRHIDAWMNWGRRGVLRRRISRSFAVVVALTAIGTGLVLLAPRFFSERNMMEAEARSFSNLVADSLIHSADLYRSTGGLILKKQVEQWMSDNSDLTRIEVAHVQGYRVLLADRNGLRSFPDPATSPEISDPAVLQAVRSLQPSAARVRGEDGSRLYRVIVPAREDWGRRTYSLIAYFDYGHLYRQLISSALGILLLVAIAVAGAVIVADALSGPIVSDIEVLRDAVQRFQEGDLDEEVEINSGDEVEELANSFNEMAKSLKSGIEELEAAKRELEVLDESKATVVANISHELRTPLTAMAGYLELLEEGSFGDLGDEALHAVSVCRRNLKRLQLRIDELVQLSRSNQSDPQSMSFEVIHLGRMLHSVVETLLPDLGASEVYCSLNLATDLPPIWGNVEQIERVFLNLLSNAAKFTPAGGFIRVMAEPLVRDGREGVLVRVADTGPGIPEPALGRVFDRFFQVDPSASRRYGGMGLGLALVKRIISDHGGQVWAESHEEQGSVFFTWLPLARDKSRSGSWKIPSRDGNAAQPSAKIDDERDELRARGDEA